MTACHRTGWNCSAPTSNVRGMFDPSSRLPKVASAYGRDPDALAGVAAG
jgi:hypothetical protein